MLEDARNALTEIAETADPDKFMRAYDITLPAIERYDIIRLNRQVEGLQMYLWLHGGHSPVTWLLQLFDPKKYERFAAK